MRVAIIPARGGSKRIPRKNIKDFCGKPMISWSIEAAKASGCFDRIIVSTDDQEIADIDFQAEYQGGKSIDNPDQPVLVSKVSYRFLDNGNLSLSFAQEIADGISVSLVLDKKLKHAFLEMLLKVNEAAGWDIDLQSYQSALLDNSQSASKVH